MAIWLVLLGIASVQLGSALGKSAFDIVAPTDLTWLRLVASALVLGIWTRPWIRRHDAGTWLLILALGTVLAAMNWAFYQSIARIPIGVAVTIEFIGPLGVAAFGSRRARDLIWVGLAALGVSLLGFSPGPLAWLGVGFALAAGAAWAAYIVVSTHLVRRVSGIDGLAFASIVAAVLLTPAALLGPGAAGAITPAVLLVGCAVGTLSSAVPYALETTALRTLTPRVFSVLMSLEPAAAALAASAILHEMLNGVQWLAMACVVVASMGATRTGTGTGTDTGN